jgi:hypothetical protein
VWKLEKEKSYSEDPAGMHERLRAALDSGPLAAFRLMIGESELLTRIRGTRSDFRWAALRCTCTFSKPDLVSMAGEQDEIRKALDGAAKSGFYDAEAVGCLLRRYGRVLLFEALVVASSHGDTEQARLLIGLGARPHPASRCGDNPLSAAAAGGYGAGVIRLLLEHGAGRNGDLEEALKVARRCRHRENVRALMEGKK